MKMKRLLIIIAIIASYSAANAQQWLDKAVPDGKVDNVWKGTDLPQGFTGKGVIIGVTDWGFDYTHPVFYDTSMTRYRVLGAWDQFRTAGPAPEGFSYGTEIMGKDALLKAQCDTFSIYQYGYHGTHVSSIAGGAGAGTKYKGIANDAEFLFVSIQLDEQAVMDAFQWLYNMAKKEQKRLVINMSWGVYYMENNDGTGRIANCIRNLTDSGVVFVTSAGNNGDCNFHLFRDFSTNSDTLKSQFLFDNLNQPNTYGQAISMLTTPGCDFQFGITAMDKEYKTRCFSGFFSTLNDAGFIDTFMVYSDSLHQDTLRFNAKIEHSNPYNQRPQVLLKVKTPPSGYQMGLFVIADSGQFHAWNVVEITTGIGNWGDDFKAPMTGWSAGDNGYGLGTPAATPCLISVASHLAKYKMGAATRGGEISSFSSAGPNVDGSVKPEISAPGSNVVSAISSFTTRYNGSYTQTITFNERSYGFAALNGTSMASPFVSGVVALMLQANPYLTPAEVKGIITSTATQDYDTRHDGPERFGYGKINALDAVKKALEMNGTQDFRTDHAGYAVFPNPSSGQFYVTFQGDGTATAELFDVNGRLLLRMPLNPGVQPIATENLAKGIYFLRLNSRQGTDIRKVVLQ